MLPKMLESLTIKNLATVNKNQRNTVLSYGEHSTNLWPCVKYFVLLQFKGRPRVKGSGVNVFSIDVHEGWVIVNGNPMVILDIKLCCLAVY